MGNLSMDTVLQAARNLENGTCKEDEDGDDEEQREEENEEGHYYSEERDHLGAMIDNEFWTSNESSFSMDNLEDFSRLDPETVNQAMKMLLMLNKGLQGSGRCNCKPGGMHTC